VHLQRVVGLVNLKQNTGTAVTQSGSEALNLTQVTVKHATGINQVPWSPYSSIWRRIEQLSRRATKRVPEGMTALFSLKLAGVIDRRLATSQRREILLPTLPGQRHRNGAAERWP
jgi:hypothetical protein